jgi:hypothetical protein
MVLSDQLINKITWRNYNVYSEEVSFNDHRSGLHPSLGGSYAFLCPLLDPALKAA